MDRTSRRVPEVPGMRPNFLLQELGDPWKDLRRSRHRTLPGMTQGYRPLSSDDEGQQGSGRTQAAGAAWGFLEEGRECGSGTQG